MNRKQGKIIAVIGAPASGKSTLVKKLGRKLKVKIFLEGEERQLPGYIKKNIAENRNGFQTTLYFYNRTMKQYYKALKFKRKGITVILDTFWFSNIFYMDAMLKNKKEKKSFMDLMREAVKLLPLPDTIIYLEAKDKTIRQRMGRRDRNFEKKFLDNAVKINKDHKKFINRLKGTKVIKIKAEKIDPWEITNILKSNF